MAHAEATTFECSYPLNATPNKDGNVVVGRDSFSLTYLVDMEARTASLMGNNGSNEVMFLPSMNGFSLIEMTGVGNITLTTIARATAGPMKSVHSRHPIIPAGEDALLLPSQYYGTCRIK